MKNDPLLAPWLTEDLDQILLLSEDLKKDIARAEEVLSQFISLPQQESGEGETADNDLACCA